MSASALDPAVQLSLRLAFGLLLARAARHKLRDRAAFRRVVADYRILAPGLASLAAPLFAGSELCLAAGLAVAGVPAAAGVAGAADVARAAGAGAAGLFSVYGGAIAWNLARGRRDLDCGCFATRARRPLSASLVVRNAVLVAGALACALPATGRGLVWLDAATVLGGALALACLGAAADGAWAHAPRMRALGRGTWAGAGGGPRTAGRSA